MERAYLLLLLNSGTALSASLLLALALLEEGLGDEDLILGRDRPVGTSRLVRSPAYRSMMRSAGGELLRKATFSAVADSRMHLINGIGRGCRDKSQESKQPTPN